MREMDISACALQILALFALNSLARVVACDDGGNNGGENMNGAKDGSNEDDDQRDEKATSYLPKRKNLMAVAADTGR